MLTLMRLRVLFLSVVCVFSALAIGVPGPLYGEAEWINKDFTNSTTHTRNDLHWLILGHVKAAIQDTLSPPEFPQVDIEETGPAPVTWVEWSGGDVEDGATVHCGIKIDWADLPAQRFKSAAYWTQDGILQEKVAGCASVNMSIIGDQVLISAANTDDPSDPALYVSNVSYAYSPTPFALGDLTWNNPAIPWVSTPFAGTIPPDGSIDLGPVPAPGGDPYLVVQMAVNFSGDPPGNAGHIIVQREIGKKVPAASPLSSVILGLLVASIAVVLATRSCRLG